MKTKLVIFDLDGTLVDSIEGLATSMNLVLEKMKQPTHTIKAYKNFVGNGLKQLVFRALPDFYRDEKTVHQAYIEMLVHYRTYYMQGLLVYPSIEALLDELTDQGILLGVNTNKNQEMTDWIMARFFSRWQFVKIIGVEAGYEPKPNPAAALSIVEKVGIKSEECLFVGDSEVDYQTAQRAAIQCVLVTWGFRSARELSALNNEYMAHVPADVLKFLK